MTDGPAAPARPRLPRPADSIAPATYRGPFADAHPRALALEALMHQWNGRLPDEYDSLHCTTTAWCVRAAVDGEAQLWGFAEDADTDAAIRHAGWGHDFAVVDQRFLVDPWAVHYVADDAASATKYVHDLQDPDDLAEIHRLWGAPATWENVRAFASPQRLRYAEWEDADLLPFVEDGAPHAASEAAWRATLAGLTPPTSAAWLTQTRALLDAALDRDEATPTPPTLMSRQALP